ncbi:hypothetical protein E4U59_005029 [Claviceps monticola]|nr:hypothetical protein E4U59_005029 [Claviceps monticola]
MDLWRILDNADVLPPPANRCNQCGQLTPVTATEPRHQNPHQIQRTIGRTHQRSHVLDLEYILNAFGSSAEASTIFNRQSQGNIELLFDRISGTHEAQIRRDNNARASEKSRRKRIMKRLSDAEKQVRQKDEELEATRDALRQKDEKLRQKDEELRQSNAEKERLRQQLEK